MPSSCWPGELTAWTQLPLFDATPVRRWEPKKLRLRLFSIAARLSRHSRRTRLVLATTAPYTAFSSLE
ncbi:transposase [Gordonia sp. NPDC003376]